MENGAFFVLRISVEMRLFNDFGWLEWGRGDWGGLVDFGVRDVSGNIDSLSLQHREASVQRRRGGQARGARGASALASLQGKARPPPLGRAVDGRYGTGEAKQANNEQVETVSKFSAPLRRGLGRWTRRGRKKFLWQSKKKRDKGEAF